VALTGIEIIDTAGGLSRTEMTVVVRGHRIVEIDKSSVAKIPAGARVIDASGKFLIPGLWDMHFHTFFGDTAAVAREVTLPLLIAAGVTGVRDMGSDLESIVKARAEIVDGRLLGPRMVVAGPMLDGPSAKYPASISIGAAGEGRRAVAMLKARGVDFIKIQSGVPRDAYLAIADECRKQKIAFVGHVPDAVPTAEAVRSGQRSFEHLIGIFEASSSAEEQFLKGGKSPGRFLDTYDAAKERAFVRTLANRRVWQCPTLFWERGQWLVDAIDVARDPDVAYAPTEWRQTTWPKWHASILKELDTDPLPVREAFVEHELLIVARLHRAGVPFLAGTDSPAGVGVIPGFSLHRELERFVAAGFTPLEALQTATINAATFLGLRRELGSVEKGKLADLVVLDADPRIRVTNTRRINAVVAAGRYLSRADLDRLLAGVSERSASLSGERGYAIRTATATSARPARTSHTVN
jgi:imidazolonepropionase-like amidohydrolase